MLNLHKHALWLMYLWRGLIYNKYVQLLQSKTVLSDNSLLSAQYSLILLLMNLHVINSLSFFQT